MADRMTAPQRRLTEAQRRAVKWLHERGDEGVLDRYGRVVAAGEACKHHDATTWLRLMSAGLFFGDMGRVGLTARGISAALRAEEGGDGE